MNLKKYVLIGASFFMGVAFSQTKLIAYKSHSGSMKNFDVALVDPTFDLVNHNLGAAPEPFIRTAQIDSVIYISDSLSVMVTSQYCTPNDWYYRSELDTSKIPESTIWRAGKDTVVNHPLFSHQHSLDSIKTVLKQDYYFRNNIEKAVFVGYDNGPTEPMMDEDKDGILDNEDTSTPLSASEDESSPIIVTPSSPNGGTGIILMSIVLASILIGLMSWMVSRRTANSVSV
jgi:hypothetical protein